VGDRKIWEWAGVVGDRKIWAHVIRSSVFSMDCVCMLQQFPPRL